MVFTLSCWGGLLTCLLCSGGLKRPFAGRVDVVGAVGIAEVAGVFFVLGSWGNSAAYSTSVTSEPFAGVVFFSLCGGAGEDLLVGWEVGGADGGGGLEDSSSLLVAPLFVDLWSEKCSLVLERAKGALLGGSCCCFLTVPSGGN